MPDLSARSEVAGYRIEAVAGRGGMGVVYRATDLTLERPVVLKVISDEFAQDAGAAADSGNDRVYRSTPPKLDKDFQAVASLGQQFKARGYRRLSF